jgi:hypothetical protein
MARANKSNSEALIAEFVKRSDGPTREFARTLEGCAVTLGFEDDAIQIASIEALEPNRGAGTRAMLKICELADAYGVELRLIADPFKDKNGRRMKRADLMAWYERFGFVKRKPGSYVMKRHARGKECQNAKPARTAHIAPAGSW